MDAEKINVYQACDKAIQAMNRENLEAFGQLKLQKWDQINVISVVTAVYTKSKKKARKRYYEVAFEAYLLGMAMCGIEPMKAHELAEKVITMDWIDDILGQTDFVTLYRFDTEAERKAYRLAEALEVAEDRGAEIDKALRFWSQQLGQYAINVTDYAMIQAFQNAGIEWVQWVSEQDDRVCNECHAYDGQVFRIDKVPVKPHWGCRCHYAPVFKFEKSGG